MADRTLTINHADGDSETYTIKRDKFAGVRSMSVDGDTVTVDHTAVPKEQAKETTFGGSQSITIKREIEPLLSEVVGGASAAYSLRDLNDKAGNSKVVRVRRASDNCERDFRANEVEDIATWVNTQTVPPLDLQELDADGHRTGDLVEAAAAYSLRNLSASYTGNVVEVRRSSDDAEESFTAAEVADGTLVAWVGAGNDGFVSQWYDQSGNGNHATQGTPASQPKIVDGGSLVTDANDKPEMVFDGSNDWLDLGASQLGNTEFFADSSDSWFITGVGTYDSGTFISKAVATSSQRELHIFYDLGQNTVYTRGQFTQFSSATNRRIISFNWDGSNAVAGVDGASNAVNVGSAVKTNQNINIGSRTNGGFPLNGSIQEIIIYNSDQSDNRTAFEANIGETYGIDLPSGVDTGYDQVDGFVETWYDQSGNGNDATQQVAGSQPKIVDAGVLVSGGIDFDGVNDGLSVSGQVLTSSLFYATSVMNHATGTSTAHGQNAFGQYQIGTSGRFQLSANSSSEYSFFANATDPIVGFSTGAIGTSQTLVSVNGNGSNAEIWRDGTSKATDTYSGFTPATVNFTIGIDAAGDREFNGKIQELIIYNSDQSANRAAIETNINNQYDIY